MIHRVPICNSPAEHMARSLAGVGLCLLVAWAIVLAGAIGALRR